MVKKKNYKKLYLEMVQYDKMRNSLQRSLFRAQERLQLTQTALGVYLCAFGLNLGMLLGEFLPTWGITDMMWLIIIVMIGTKLWELSEDKKIDEKYPKEEVIG